MVNRMTASGMPLPDPNREIVSARPTIQNATLLAEGGPNTFTSTTGEHLARLLGQTQTEWTVVYAQSNWFNPNLPPNEEMVAFGEPLTLEGTAFEAYRDSVWNSMNQAGFSITSEHSCSTREQDVTSLVDTLEDSEQQLLVITNLNTSERGARTSHFAFSLAAHSRLPVLMLRRPLPAGNQPFQVMLGVDGSEASMNAARQLSTLVNPQKLNLTLVTVQSPIYQENAVLAPYVNQAVLDEAQENNARMVFEMVSDILEPQGIAVTERLQLIGSPASELGHLAENMHPDLIVVGSHNRTGILSWLMGSVSSQLLHWDTHNLLVVR